MTISDRYSTAIRSSNLGSKPETVQSDSDVIGAIGYAGKETRTAADGSTYSGAPLATALLRLFMGDNHGTTAVIGIMSDMAWRYADRNRLKLRRIQAEDIARAVLAWHRDGVCKTCGGHGFDLTPGGRDSRRALTDRPCPACKGTGKLIFDRQFRMDHLLVARWLLVRIEEEQSKAGPAALAALAPRLNL